MVWSPWGRSNMNSSIQRGDQEKLDNILLAMAPQQPTSRRRQTNRSIISRYTTFMI
jgi:hypothetical protein